MLVLSRKVGERIVVGDDITIVVNRISGNRVSIGVEAPEHIQIVRGELERIARSFETDEANCPEPTIPLDTGSELTHSEFLSAP